MGETESLILPMLREIRGILRDHGHKLDELTTRVSTLEQQYAGIVGQNVGILAKLDRPEERMDRVEQRLGLVDPGFAEPRSPYRT